MAYMTFVAGFDFGGVLVFLAFLRAVPAAAGRSEPVSDPRGWEALTQQEAEQDARRLELDQLREWLASDGVIYGCTLTPGEAHLLADAFDAAVRERDEARGAAENFEVEADIAKRERDQARDALRRIAEGSTVIDYDTPSLAREIARAALAVGENATEGET